MTKKFTDGKCDVWGDGTIHSCNVITVPSLSHEMIFNYQMQRWLSHERRTQAMSFLWL